MMIRRPLYRSSAILATSLAAFVPKPYAKAAEGEKYTKKLRESVLSRQDLGRTLNTGPGSGTGEPDPPKPFGFTSSTSPSAKQYAWKTGIVTTTFWIGETAAKNNPVPNHASSWDPQWARNYGGTDSPEAKQRSGYRPANFVPQQNPFYIALPYNDVTKGQHKPEAAQVIPWFKTDYKGPGVSVLKGRWIAIRYQGRTAYAQWEDCGPFRTDHSGYVFGTERPKPNLNKGAGLDVSPAVRDYLGMAPTDVTDWKFVELADVPKGPWADFGSNNPFVMDKRIDKTRLVQADNPLEPRVRTRE